MKKLIFVFLVLFTPLFLTKCTEENFTEQGTKKVLDYFYLGDIHNDFIDNVVQNYPEDTTSVSIGQCFDKIKTFHQNYASSNWTGSALEMGKVADFSDEFKQASSQTYFYSQISGSTPWNLNTNINLVYRANIIDADEKDILEDLAQIILDNKNDGKSAELIVVDIEALIARYDDLEFSKSSKKGDLTAIILAISLRSAEWWSQNSESLKSGQIEYRVAPWVATDLGGALLGATISAWREYSSTGDVSFGNIATGAVIVGVSASTGLAGKIGKGITRFFGW